MKLYFKVIISLFAICCVSCGIIPRSEKIKSDNNKIRVGSYNIRIDAKGDKKKGNDWNNRKEHVAEIIKKYDFDIFGKQEGYEFQLLELMELLPDYSYVSYFYGGKEGKSGTASVIYKKDRFEVVEDSVFWYSETPDIESLGWDADDSRICTWVRLRDKNEGKEFYFLTSHFYWRYKTARENSGKLMVKKMKEINKDNIPLISTGDLNSVPSSTQIKDILTILKDSRVATKTPPEGPEGTNLGGGNFYGPAKNRIDFILVNDKVDVLSYKAIEDTYDGGRFPSDHLPIFSDVLLK